MSPELTRDHVDSGTPWEANGGYCRAVRIGEWILVSGTAAAGPEGLVGTGDPAAQADFIVDKIAKAIVELGGSLRDVVRTRIYIRNVGDIDSVARVHGKRFGAIRPANTLVQTNLVGDEYLVEIEADAVIGAGDALNVRLNTAPA